MHRCALTIAGSDPSGGAGLQADLKTFHQHRVYGTSVVTLITVQNTQTVSRVSLLAPDLVAEQFNAVTSDLPIAAVKTGALGSTDIVLTVSQCLELLNLPLVVDPVIVSTHGEVLLQQDAQQALIKKLLPQALLLTPNISEAELLSGITITSIQTAKSAGEKILSLGAQNVLIKGGHIEGNEALDILVGAAGYQEFTGEKLVTKNTHGSGCVLSAAITAHLANGRDLLSAIRSAKTFVSEGIRTAPIMTDGYGPLNLFTRT